MDPSPGGVIDYTSWRDKKTLDESRIQMSMEIEGIQAIGSLTLSIRSSGDDPWPRMVGNQWTETITMTSTFTALWETHTEEETFTLRYVVEKIEDVTVPAGTFRCFKIVEYESGKGVTAYWYSDKAKKTVKIDDLTSDDSQQLLSYSVKNGGL